MDYPQGGSVPGEVKLANLIPDLSTFVRHTFDRSPAIFPGAMASRLHSLPRLKDLDELLRTRALPYLQLERDSLVPKSAYTYPASASGGPAQVDVAKVWQLYAAGHTLVIGQMEEVWPTTSTIMGPLSRALASRTNALAVATAAHHRGIRPHADELDVVVIQAEGTKNWRVWPTPSGGRDGFKFVDVDKAGAPRLEVTLQPGDVLYLPHGTPHAAETKDRQSVHLSITLQLPTWDDILTSVLGSATADMSSKTVVALTDDNLSVIADQLSQRLGLLREVIASLDLEAEIHNVRSRLLASLGAANYPADQLFTFMPTEIQILDSTGDGSQVRVGRQTATIPHSILATVTTARVAEKPVTCQQLFPDLPNDSAMTVALQLLQLGVLTLAPTEHSHRPTQPAS